MDNAIGDQLRPVVIPVHGTCRRIDRRRGQLLQSENGHVTVCLSMEDMALPINEGMPPADRVKNVALDFGPSIATFCDVVLRKLRFLTPDFNAATCLPVSRKSSKRRGFLRG